MTNAEQQVFVRKRYLPLVVVVTIVTLLCVGVTGLYTGSTLQAAKDSGGLSETKRAMQEQKLDYEKRLGTQSKQFANELAQHGLDSAAFALALSQLNTKIDASAAERRRAQQAAIAAAQKAVAVAAATAKTTDKILAKQDGMQHQVDEAASAAKEGVTVAKATEKRLDTATRPVAAVPAHKWNDGNR
ncbi:MAG: hypothetical protein ACRYG5_06620 [Janthinobacterium lividum]